MKISTSTAMLSKSSVIEEVYPFETRYQNGSTPIPIMTATER